MKRLNWLKTAGAVCAFYAMSVAGAPAQTFTTLYSFCAVFGCPDGNSPIAGLVQGTNGDFYGSASGSGPNNQGTLFKITTAGNLTTVLGFDGTDGSGPTNALLLAIDGNFYGITGGGGNHGEGTLYKVTPAGNLTTLYNFCQKGGCTDGAGPGGALVEGTDGNFYGTTSGGGTDGDGIVFKITPRGAITTLHFFEYSDGTGPLAGLVQATNGNFYGTTNGGGAYGYGTVFEITPQGTLTTLHDFTGGVDGAFAQSALIQGVDGNLYGVTPNGGAHGPGNVFRITLDGTLTTLYSFCAQSNCVDGASPAGLIQGTDGNFYGPTRSGGGDNCGGGCGVLFEVTPAGVETVVHTFVHTDGVSPNVLVQATNGILYGSALSGGANDEGSIFGLDVGLGPFVKTTPVAGKVNQRIIILGTSLTGATSVTFNGTPATFKVASGSLISSTVPAGATTGPVQVVTPSGTLTSNVSFEVLP